MKVKLFFLSFLSCIVCYGQTTYSYDSLNRLDTVIEHNGEYRAYEYDEIGNRIGKSFGIITPDSNYILKGYPEHCYRGKDGNIEINTKVFFRWDISIIGTDVNIDTNYSWENHTLEDPLRIGNIPPGNYEVCFTVGSYPESIFKECEMVTVTEGAFTNAPKFSATKQGSSYEVKVTEGNPPFNVYKNSQFYNRYEDYNFTIIGEENDQFEVIDSCGHSARMKLQNGIVGISDVSANTLKVYPNPTSNNLVIELNGSLSEPLTFNLLGINGQKVFKGTLTQSRTTVDMTTLGKGVYFVHIDGYEPKRVVKE